MTLTKQNLFIIKIEGMLQASELRIGNWVNNDGYYEQVDFTDIADLSTGCGGAHLYKPIVLTPEILEKAGGSSTKRDWDYYLQVGGLKMHFRKFADEWYSEIGEIYLGGHIQHLHSLQNLYFALTGTELNINL